MAKTNFTRLFSYSGLHSACMKSTMLVLVFLLVGCGGGNFHPPQLAPFHPVIFFGDSIFAEWDLDKYFPGKGYVDGGMIGYRTDQLKAILPDVLSGNKVCHGLEGNDTFPLTCVTVSTPTAIVIMAGWNNFFAGDPSTALADLQSMAAMANAKGVKVIICTLYSYDPAHPAPWMKPIGNAPVTFYDVWRNPLNHDIGSIPGITVVDFDALFGRQTDYTLDGVHPNDSAYAQMRDLLAQSLLII